MSIHRFESSQFLRATPEEAWAFFATPRNLAAITPPNMRFELTSSPPPRMYPGLVITYRLRPFGGVPVSWVTEITHIEELHRFVDEQRVGPYRMWHHEHTFIPVPGGVEARDLIYYVLPGGPLGQVVDRWFVGPRVRAIFEHRRGVLAARFGELAPPATGGRVVGAPGAGVDLGLPAERRG